MAENGFKVLMYSHDGFGLGHVRRNLSIARHLLELNPDSSILVLAGTIPPGTNLPTGIEIIKLPSIIKSGKGAWCSRSLTIDNDELKEIRSGIIEHVARAFQPNIFLVDFIPTGVWGELVPTLKYLNSNSYPTHTVLGLREFIDDPESTRQQWVSDGTFEAITNYYSRIFVYGKQEIYDTVENYGLKNYTNHMPVEYCGYVCSPPVSCKKSEIYRDFGLEIDQKLVLVTGGGGSDAYPMMKKCLDAMRLLSEKSAVYGLFVTGPLMRQEDLQALREAATGYPAHIITQAHNLYDFINSADLVVSMAGYNTLTEALGSGRKVLAIPREGPSAEQRMRADKFSSRGFLETVSLDRESPDSLANLIYRMIRDNAAPRSRLATDGLSMVADRLLQLGDRDTKGLFNMNMANTS